ncbi:hypothetical protein GFO_0439 [Christiangramia forsetii KT0803]|uniref:Uncharacterized protein n=1 Tax=Christiangramia forsetii (strain DSM 17595 / CGMCC 1.15422 / KT0803) TaxID=411154 RepID=A0LYH7_CHRFK|nr:hypothetical protein GFO_0439 [Christiangramia forsetii KT0803]
MNHKKHNNWIFTDDQIITTDLVSALYFRGKQFLTLDYMRSTLSKRSSKRVILQNAFAN